MRSPPRTRGSLGRRTVALLALSLTVGAWLPASAPAALSERPPLVLGSLFGEHDGLTLVDDAAGASALAWRTTTGEGQAIGFAEIPPGGNEASSVQTVVASASHRLSTPVLAISPAGRVAVAWFEQRETEQEWSEDVLAVKVRERAPDGTWEATRTLWRAPAKPVYGSRNLVVALDDSGDAAVLWTIERELAANPQPSQLLVATRAGGGTYGEPVTLDREAAEALPALAVTPSGEVTALWAGPWRTSQASLNAVSWRAGSSPGAGRISLDQIGASESHGSDEPFGSLSLQTSGSGWELAVWSKGAARFARTPRVRLRASGVEASRRSIPSSQDRHYAGCGSAGTGAHIVKWGPCVGGLERNRRGRLGAAAELRNRDRREFPNGQRAGRGDGRTGRRTFRRTPMFHRRGSPAASYSLRGIPAMWSTPTKSRLERHRGPGQSSVEIRVKAGSRNGRCCSRAGKRRRRSLHGRVAPRPTSVRAAYAT